MAHFADSFNGDFEMTDFNTITDWIHFDYQMRRKQFVNDNEIVELYLSRNEDAINQTAQKYGSRLRNGTRWKMRR